MNSLTGPRSFVDVALPVSEFPDWFSPIVLRFLALLVVLAECTMPGGAATFPETLPFLSTLVLQLVLPIILACVLALDHGTGINKRWCFLQTTILNAFQTNGPVATLFHRNHRLR